MQSSNETGNRGRLVADLSTSISRQSSWPGRCSVPRWTRELTKFWSRESFPDRVESLPSLFLFFLFFPASALAFPNSDSITFGETGRAISFLPLRFFHSFFPDLISRRSKMVSANREMAVYCFDTLVAHYNSEEAPPPTFDEGQHPLFVTWKKAINGSEPRLRGCIGTLEARALINGFKDYALTSALRDRRFPPIQAKELPYIECTVSILTDYETALHYLDWEVGKHGLIIEFTDPDFNVRRSATYLPEVAAHEGWTKIETIDSLMRKAGYNGYITDSLRKRIHMTRYQSTLYTMHYSDYIAYVRTTRGVAPTVGFTKPNH